MFQTDTRAKKLFLLLAVTATMLCSGLTHRLAAQVPGDLDGTAEGSASIDYTDDWVEKTVESSKDPATATAARVWIFGQPYNYVGHEFQTMANYVIRVNGQFSQEVSFDVGELFSGQTGVYQWASVDIPVEWLVDGTNTLRITELRETEGWTFNNLRVGVDTDNDLDKSKWYGNGETCGQLGNCAGELMIFLDLLDEPVFPTPTCPATRTEDGVAEASVSIDYRDDHVQKTIDLDPSNAGQARLWIFGQPYNFPNEVFQDRDDYRIEVNGDPNQVIAFDVGEAFDYQTDIFQWVPIDVPVEWLVSGANTFRITETHVAEGWLSNNLNIGVDTDNDEDKSSWYGNGQFCGSGAACTGELMIYMELCQLSTGPAVVRADCNGDSLVDVSDAIFTMGYLFRGTGRPGCVDSCDSNGDGLVNGSDPVYSFQFVYLGGPPPPAPYPGCGPVSADKSISCDNYTACQ